MFYMFYVRARLVEYPFRVVRHSNRICMPYEWSVVCQVNVLHIFRGPYQQHIYLFTSALNAAYQRVYIYTHHHHHYHPMVTSYLPRHGKSPSWWNEPISWSAHSLPHHTAIIAPVYLYIYVVQYIAYTTSYSIWYSSQTIKCDMLERDSVL